MQAQLPPAHVLVRRANQRVSQHRVQSLAHQRRTPMRKYAVTNLISIISFFSLGPARETAHRPRPIIAFAVARHRIIIPSLLSAHYL
jgi:hypothetical protein